MSNTASSQQPNRKVSAERLLVMLALAGLLPVALLLLLLWLAEPLNTLALFLLSIGSGLWIIGFAKLIRQHFVHQLRTLSTLVEAIRIGDYSLRGTLARETGDLAELYQQINDLTGELQLSRQQETELRGLLERIIAHMNVAVVAYDSQNSIVLANHLFETLLGQSPGTLTGRSLTEFAIQPLLAEQNSIVVEHSFPGARGRWQLSRQTYIHNGKPGNLLFIADLEQVLSEEEVKAWQRLIRVIAHEVNNSLTPITSLCQTLTGLLARIQPPPAQVDDVLGGLEVIHERALNLRNFISDYARIARLPETQKKQFDLLPLLHRLLTIYQQQHPVEIVTQVQSALVFGDQAQIEQVLINLLKNAIEATQDSALPIQIELKSTAPTWTIGIRDNGSGISNPANLFVPFYTTKPQGAGIGLALSRRIASAHNGELQLHNRKDGPGAVAILTLPQSH